MKATLISLVALISLVGCGGSGGGGNNPLTRTIRAGILWPGTEEGEPNRESVKVAIHDQATDVKIDEYITNAPADKAENQYTWRSIEVPKVALTVRTTGYAGTNGSGAVVGTRTFEFDADVETFSFNPVP